jgi:IclR family mhp operon transcriptional activator
MLIRDTTDHASPLAVERFNAGFRLPLLMSAAGRVYLAFCQAEHRDALLDILSRSTREEDKLARSRPEVEKILEETRELGYATSVRTRRISEEVAMSVPVLIGERVLATIAVRFSASAVPLRLAVERFVPKLFDTANVIRQRFSAAHPPV